MDCAAACCRFRVGQPAAGGERGSFSGDLLAPLGALFTELASLSNVQIIIPNAQVWCSVIETSSIYKTRRAEWVFGVGYGETQPVDTPLLRWLTITLIVCGYVAAIYTVGGFAQLLIDGELRRILGVKRMQKEIDKLRNGSVDFFFGRLSSLTDGFYGIYGIIP